MILLEPSGYQIHTPQGELDLQAEQAHPVHVCQGLILLWVIIYDCYKYNIVISRPCLSTIYLDVVHDLEHKSVQTLPLFRAAVNNGEAKY